MNIEEEGGKWRRIGKDEDPEKKEEKYMVVPRITLYSWKIASKYYRKIAPMYIDKNPKTKE